MNFYLKLVLLPLASGVAAGTAVAGTTQEWWPIGVATLSAFATSLLAYIKTPPTRARNAKHTNTDDGSID